MNIPQWIIVHHTGGSDANPLADSSNQTFQVVNEVHRQKFDFPSSLGFYIGYHYFIDKQGNVTQGRKDTDDGAHTIGKNSQSIGICLAGNFDATSPTIEQSTALASLINKLVDQYRIPYINVVPHRTFAQKTCYGKSLSDTWARNLALMSKLSFLKATLRILTEKLFTLQKK